MPTVMVVDDSQVDRHLVGGLLERNGNFTICFAESGATALAQLEQNVPDLIVTDLQMPDKDGLELVTAIRIHYSQVPVILITAHGSETLAVKALEQGAASYVPKSQLNEKLVETVEDVLALARADRSYERLIRCLDRTEFEFSLDNDPALIDPLVDFIQQIVAGMELCDVTDRFRIGVALKEALLNALYRGNLEISFGEMQDARENLLRGEGLGLVDQRRTQPPYRDRKIFVKIQIHKDQAEFLVRDEGPGFDLATVRVPANIALLEPESGRGMVLMRAFMDSVAYNDRGNEVTMVKRRNSHRAAGEVAPV